MKKQISIIIFILTFGISLGFILKTPGEVLAGSEHNVFGWAWAENIGWISFNSINCDANDDGFSNGTPAGCPSAGTPMAKYGVNIESDGRLTGYAWSGERGATTTDPGGIGWIRFNPPPETYLTNGYPTAPYHSAKVDLDGSVCGGVGKVCGWARACAGTANPQTTCSGGPNPAAGGWDGWIKLRGTIPSMGIPYGARIDFSGSSPYEFHDWAWGGDDSTSTAVIGWVSFNCENCQGNSSCDEQATCGDAHKDYKVLTSFSSNQPPYIEAAAISGPLKYCELPGVVQVSFSWTYKDAEGDSQSSYRLQIATDSSFNNIVVDKEISQSVAPNGEGSSAILVVPNPATYSKCISGGDFENRCVGYNNNYYWRVSVKSASGNPQWSDWKPSPPQSFNAPAHAYPWPNFDWSPDEPSVGEIIQLCATNATSTCDPSQLSVCYDSASNPISCSGKTFEWTRPSNAEFATGTTASSENPRIQFFSWAEEEENEVTLKITDDVGFCEKSKNIGVSFLPKYKEVPPVSWFKSLLAAASGFFAKVF